MLPGLAGKKHIYKCDEKNARRNGLALDGVLRDVRQRWRTLGFGPDGYR